MVFNYKLHTNIPIYIEKDKFFQGEFWGLVCKF